MPRFKITHAIEATITHVIEAANAEEANGIALEETLLQAATMNRKYPQITFGTIDDQARPPLLLSP